MAPITFFKQVMRNFGNYTALPFITGIHPSTTTAPISTTSDIASTSISFTIATAVFQLSTSEIITATAVATTPTFAEHTTSSIIPTTVIEKVKEVGKKTDIGVGEEFKASLHPRPINKLGTWAYIALAMILAILAWVVVFSLYKCCCDVKGVTRTSKGSRKKSSLRKLEEGKEDIALKPLESSDEDNERKVQLKISNGSLGTSEDTSVGGGSLLMVPSKVLLKDTRVLFPPGLDAFNIPFATPDKRWRNPKLSPIRGTIIPPEVVMYK